MKNKQNKNGNSMKGKRGSTVGAPPKPTKWPTSAFTMATLFERNSKGEHAQCQLSLRNKVDALLESGELIALKTKRQPNHAVGRPKDVFVLKANFNTEKHERLDGKTVTTVVKTKTKSKTRKARSVVAVTDSVASVVPPIAPAPVVSQPVTEIQVSASAVLDVPPAVETVSEPLVPTLSEPVSFIAPHITAEPVMA